MLVTPRSSPPAMTRTSADEVVFLDITASSDARDILLDAVRRTADRVFIPLTVGGGVADCRGHRCAAARRRGQGVTEHGGTRSTGPHRGGCETASGPVRRGGRRLQAHRWRARVCTPTGAASTRGAMPSTGRAEAAERGAGEILLTSMDRDGTGSGYDLELTAAVVSAVTVPGDRERRRRQPRASPQRAHRDRRVGRRARRIDLPFRRAPRP